MKQKYIKIIIVAVIVVSISLVLLDFTRNISPYYDEPAYHENDLKMIPQITEFYNLYEDNYDITIFTKKAEFYQIGFWALEDDKRARLLVNYFLGEPISVSYYCDIFSIMDIQIITKIKNAETSQIINCF